MSIFPDMSYFLAELVDSWDEGFDIINAGDEDLVLDCFGPAPYGAGERFETADDVVACSVRLARFREGAVRTSAHSRSSH